MESYNYDIKSYSNLNYWIKRHSYEIKSSYQIKCISYFDFLSHNYYFYFFWIKSKLITFFLFICQDVASTPVTHFRSPARHSLMWAVSQTVTLRLSRYQSESDPLRLSGYQSEPDSLRFRWAGPCRNIPSEDQQRCSQRTGPLQQQQQQQHSLLQRLGVSWLTCC